LIARRFAESDVAVLHDVRLRCFPEMGVPWPREIVLLRWLLR